MERKSQRWMDRHRVAERDAGAGGTGIGACFQVHQAQGCRRSAGPEPQAAAGACGANLEIGWR